MSTMISKQVNERVRSSREVCMALDTHVVAALPRLAHTFAPHVPEGQSLPLDVFSGTLRRWLEAETRAMAKADEDHHAELRDDAPVLARRDQLATELYQLVTSIRATYTERFGTEFGATLGVKGQTPVDAQGLLAFSGNLARAVEEVAAQNPKSARSFVTIDHALALSTLRELRDALGASLTDASRERRENEASQLAKNRAIESYDAAFRFVATFAELTLTAAGETELAARVRPSRRPGVTVGVAEDPGPDTPAEPTPSPDAPTP